MRGAGPAEYGLRVPAVAEGRARAVAAVAIVAGRIVAGSGVPVGTGPDTGSCSAPDAAPPRIDSIVAAPSSTTSSTIPPSRTTFRTRSVLSSSLTGLRDAGRVYVPYLNRGLPGPARGGPEEVDAGASGAAGSQ